MLGHLNLSEALAGRKKYVEAHDENTAGGTEGHGNTSLMKLRASNETGMAFIEKSSTGYTGLINQGATCYLNSLIQSLFFLPDFKSALYKSDFSCGQESMNLGRQLQKLFAELELSERGAVTTNALTKSFGWSARDSFQQQDVQECMTVIFEFMKVSYPDSEIAKWLISKWQGEIKSYLLCSNCLVARSKRSETFRDLQLQVKGMETLMNSLHAYFQDEELDGVQCDNCSGRYSHAQQKCLDSENLPEILTIQLRRFDMDWNTFQRVKVYDALDIDTSITVSPNVLDSSTLELCPTYDLVSVMMHSGSAFSGHYFCYLLAPCGQWMLFNDSSVTALSEDEVRMIFSRAEETNNGSGVANSELRDVKKKMLLPVNRHAYMLVYRRRTSSSTEVKYESPPESVVKAIQEENKRYLVAKKEYEEERSYLHITIHDKSPVDEVSEAAKSQNIKVFRIHQDKTLKDLTDIVFESFFVENVCDNNPEDVKVVGNEHIASCDGYSTPAVNRNDIRLRAYDLIKNELLPVNWLIPSLEVADSDDAAEPSVSQIQAETTTNLQCIADSRFEKYIFVEVNCGLKSFSPFVDDMCIYMPVDHGIACGDCTVFLQVFNSSKDNESLSCEEFISMPSPLSIPRNSPWQHWRQSIFTVLSQWRSEQDEMKFTANFQQNNMQVVALIKNSQALPIEDSAVLVTDDANSRGHISTSTIENILAGNKNELALYVSFECFESDNMITDSPLLNRFERMLYKLPVKVNCVNVELSTKTDTTFILDVRNTLAEAKKVISEKIGWSVDAFRYVSGNDKGGVCEIKDTTSLLSKLLMKKTLQSNEGDEEIGNGSPESERFCSLQDDFDLTLTVENIPPLAVGEFRASLVLKELMTDYCVADKSPTQDVPKPVTGRDSSVYTPFHSLCRERAKDCGDIVFHQDECVSDIKRRILKLYGYFLRISPLHDNIESDEDIPLRLQLVVVKSNSKSSVQNKFEYKATMTLSDHLPLLECIKNKSGSLGSVDLKSLCVTVKGVQELSFHRDVDMLLSLWQWIPASCRVKNAMPILRNVGEFVIPQSSCFQDIKNLIIYREHVEEDSGLNVQTEQIYFAKPFAWQLRAPEENIPQLNWANQPESDKCLLLEAPFRLQTYNRTKHMAPPVLLFKRCRPDQLVEIIDGENGLGSSDSQQSGGLANKGKGNYRPPEAGGFKLFTPEEQASKQLEDKQFDEDRVRVLQTLDGLQDRN